MCVVRMGRNESIGIIIRQLQYIPECDLPAVLPLVFALRKAEEFPLPRETTVVHVYHNKAECHVASAVHGTGMVIDVNEPSCHDDVNQTKAALHRLPRLVLAIGVGHGLSVKLLLRPS